MVKGRFLCHTENLKFLDKATILEDNEISAEKQNPWRVTTVTKVEELKLIVNGIPIWLASIPFGMRMSVAQTTTFFIKQGTTVNQKIGAHNFLIPPASIFVLSAIAMIVCVTIYDKIIVPILRRVMGNERGLNILQRIGFDMIFSVATMIVAALVERKRLNVVLKNPNAGSTSMSIFWIAPQFIIIGEGDAFTLVGLQDYFYDQVPDSMRSLGIAFYFSLIGAGNFMSSLFITLIDYVTGRNGKSWFGSNLNSSRLDNYYWVLAGIATANLFVYVFLARQ